MILEEYTNNKEWDKEMGQDLHGQSVEKEVEKKLRKIYSLNKAWIFLEEELKEVQKYELKREELLAKEDELWRLKNRDIWIKEGDSNTKNFHRHATHRKNI